MASRAFLHNPSSRSIAKMKEQPKKKKNKLNVQKLRMGLENPNYERDFEFPADAPGRVIVRLERLMGTDRIRITDVKYLATLLTRLEEEENELWKKRSWERRKAEYNRFRQLVIDGYTDPLPGMEDLQNHPVFRVNRILNRLSKLDYNLIGPVLHMPPIDPVEPFEDDDTGEIFKSYPGHIQFAHLLEMMARTPSHYVRQNKSSISRSRHASGQFTASMLLDAGEDTKIDEKAPTESAASIARNFLELQTKSEENRRKSSMSIKRVSIMPPGSKTSTSATKDFRKMAKPSASDVSNTVAITLRDIQKKYGVAPNVDLGAQWKPYRSEIVDALYTDEDKGVLELYQMGDDIVCMYEREQLKADDYINSFNPPEKEVESNEVVTDQWTYDEDEGETEEDLEGEEEDEDEDENEHLEDYYDYTTSDVEDDNEEEQFEYYQLDEEDKGYDASAE